MTEDEAFKTALWMGEIFPDLNPEQVGIWQKRFHGVEYVDRHVRESLQQLRTATSYFNTERFNAILNRVRLQSVDPAEKLTAAYRESEARRQADKAMLERKATLQARLDKLGAEERAALAQKAIDRLPEDLLGLIDRMQAIRPRDPLEFSSVREMAGAILDGEAE